MAQKMKENFQKNAASVPKQTVSTPNSTYINRAGKQVPLITPNNSNTSTTKEEDVQEKSNDSEDSESIKGMTY